MNITSLDMSGHPDFDGHETVLECRHQASGLHAYIAVHNTTLGPALGGCRMWPYESEDNALSDVLRLSKGMTYKSALANLPLGGGKAVILGNSRKDKSRALLLAMGEFIDSLRGRYITAEDSGTSVADLRVIRERTEYASGVSELGDHGGDPSPTTALGTFIGLKAAVNFRLGKGDLRGVKVAIQGIGNVGSHLAKLLVEAGAQVYAADIHQDNLQGAVQTLGITAVPVETLHTLDVDVFSPCALGGAVNERTIGEIKAPVIAGAANNQLQSPDLGLMLHRRGTLYVPDYALNAGGIIDICYQYFGLDYSDMRCHVEGTAATLLEIFQSAEKDDCSTESVANRMVEERLVKGKPWSPSSSLGL